MPFRPSLLIAPLLLLATGAVADPLTRQLEIDFGRDVASRNLQGLAARSDGRLLPGPVFTDLSGPKLGEILWSLQSTGPNRFVVGTGPDGKVQEVIFNPKDSTYTVTEIADLDETQAMTLLPLADGGLLVGTSPTAALYLIRDSKIVTRVPLPADSVFDLLALPDGSVLAATGNPGRIYRIDLKEFARAGIIAGKDDKAESLAGRGLTVFGEIRDRNVRRLTRLADGRIIAGSAPKGNVYQFSATGGAPLFLQENRDAEVVDLLPLPDGGFYAALVFSPSDIFRLAQTVPAPENKEDAPPKDIFREKEPKTDFAGRSAVVYFPPAGFPETVLGKSGVSLYRIARHQDWLLLTAGEQGDALGYDPVARKSLVFAGSASSQLNDMVSLGDGRWLVLRNNAPGLALLDFGAATDRRAETKRLDLNQPAALGAIRFSRLRGIDLSDLKLELSTNNGSDELEGWSPWVSLTQSDGAFQAGDLRGRYVKYRLLVPEQATNFQIDKPVQFHLPQNRRPALTDFRIFPPNQGLVPAGDPPPSVVTTLRQLLNPGPRESREDGADKRSNALLNSQVIPQPGVQIVYWTVNDPDGDNLDYTFSVRPEGAADWTDLAVKSSDSYVQFETGGMAEGLYLTRLTTTEQAPRPAAERLTYTFETDNLLIDHTPPVLTEVKTERRDGLLIITMTGNDVLSLLEGVEFVLNNGTRYVVLQPADGLLDGRTETFVAEVPEARAAGATSIEVILYDQAGNAASSRLPVK